MTSSPRFDSELQCDYGGPAHEPRSCAAGRPAALRNGLIGAIQAADPNHVVLFEPSGATNYGAPETIGIAEPLRFHGLALAFDMYGSPATLLPPAMRERGLTRTGQPGGPPASMDEFGASNDAIGTAATVSRAGAANLSWTYWSAMQLHDPTAADRNRLTPRGCGFTTATPWRPRSGRRPRSRCRPMPIRTAMPSEPSAPGWCRAATRRCSSLPRIATPPESPSRFSRPRVAIGPDA